MAEKRMFAKSIIDSDMFLDMPLSTQALYFHLSMRADDDGFINNPRKIQRMIGATDDDIKVLIAKKYIIPFESGIVVIKHWRIHNYIQPDRYKETVYTAEKEQLTLDENKMYTPCIQSVTNTDTQIRLDKISSDKIRKDKVKDKPPSPPVRCFGEFQHIKLTDEQHSKLVSEYGESVIAECIERMDSYLEQIGKPNKYKNFYAAIKNWIKKDSGNKPNNAPLTPDDYTRGHETEFLNYGL